MHWPILWTWDKTALEYYMAVRWQNTGYQRWESYAVERGFGWRSHGSLLMERWVWGDLPIPYEHWKKLRTESDVA
jgi:hypothetical protein